MSELIDGLDAAALALLKAATESGTVEGQAPSTLADKVRAFEAAVKWAETRNDIVKAPKEPSKFDAIRRRVNGSPNRGRGAPAPETPVLDPPSIDGI